MPEEVSFSLPLSAEKVSKVAVNSLVYLCHDEGSLVRLIKLLADVIQLITAVYETLNSRRKSICYYVSSTSQSITILLCNR